MVAEAAPVARRWTYSDVQALDGQRRIELYDGEIVEMPSPSLKHQRIIRRLMFMLELWLSEHLTGILYISPADLYVSESKCYIPDLMFFRRERYDTERIEREDGVCVIAPPDLTVEILSSSTSRNDRILKSNIYTEFGVMNYWIIDPDEETLEAFALDRGRYAIEAALEGSDAFKPALFPGLKIPLAKLFAPD